MILIGKYTQTKTFVENDDAQQVLLATKEIAQTRNIRFKLESK